MNMIVQDETGSELEQVNALIRQYTITLQALEELSSFLQSKRHSSGSVASESGKSAPNRSLLDELAKLEIEMPSLTYRGKKNLLSSATKAYVLFFEQLIRDFPDKLTEVENALAANARLRSPFGRDRNNLYSNKDKDWIEKHSRELADGWFLDVNLDPPPMLEKVRVAAGVCNLVEGRDYTICLPSKNSQ